MSQLAQLPNMLNRWSLSSLALVATIVGGIVAAWPFIEPYMAATRGYARDLIEVHSGQVKLAQSKTEMQLHSLQVDTANGKLDQTNNDLFKAQLELKKAADPSTQEFITNQINKLQSTKSAIESQIRTLNRQ